MKTSTVAAVAAGISSLLYAEQNTNEVATLPPVTVYASRTGSTKDEMPASVQLFTAAEIESSGAKDLAELLKKKAGIDVQNMNGNPVLTMLAARGFGENAFGRIKVMMDGAELNNVDMAPPDISSIPLWNIDRVEVIHGPNPVLYGDGAVAGVLNIVTDPKDYEKKTRITARAGSQNTFGGNISTKGGFEEKGLTYAAGYDYMQSGGFRKNSAYDINAVNASIRKNFENGSTLGFKINYQNAFYELPGSLNYYNWKNGRKSTTKPDDWGRIWKYGVSLDSKVKLADGQWLLLDGGFSHRYSHAVFSGYGLESGYYSYNLSPRYVNENDICEFGNKFTIGFDFKHDTLGKNDGMPGAKEKKHFNRSKYGTFAHDEFHVTEELFIVAGTRLECINNRWVGVANINKPKTTDWKSDYELGLVYRPANGLKTYVKGTRFHRSAFCDEISSPMNGDPIRPETGVSLDIGAEWDFLDEFKFDVNGYGMIMEDEIFLDPSIGLFGENRNSPAKTRRIGFDTGLSWRREKFAEASIRYGAVHADFGSGTYHGNDVPLVPNHRIRAEAGYWIFADLEIKGGYTFVGSQYLASDFNNEAGRHPAYSIFDIGLYYSPSWAKGWKASFTMDNLFDRNYCDFAGYSTFSGTYYYPACGRSFMFTLSYEF